MADAFDTTDPSVAKSIDTAGKYKLVSTGATSHAAASGGTSGASLLFPDRDVPLLEHMGPRVDWLVRRYEPVLAQRILDLTTGDDRWVVRYGKRGSSTWCDRVQRIVNIDGNLRGDELRTVRDLAHEINHAHPDGYQGLEISTSGKTRDEWVKLKTMEYLKIEGDADIEARNSRARILQQQGAPDIWLTYNLPQINAAYNEYVSSTDDAEKARDKARTEMGWMLGQTLGSWGGNDTFRYFDYYTKMAEKSWDKLMNRGAP